MATIFDYDLTAVRGKVRKLGLELVYPDRLKRCGFGRRNWIGTTLAFAFIARVITSIPLQARERKWILHAERG